MLPLREETPQETVDVKPDVKPEVTVDVEVQGEVVGENEPSDEDGMASSAERMTILRMVEQGKISAEDGARLLAALDKGQAAESKPRPNIFDASRQLQVRVTDLVSSRQK